MLVVVGPVITYPNIGPSIQSSHGAVPDIDPDFASVVLLLHCNGVQDGTSFPDNSGSAHTVTPIGPPVTDTSIKKYGTASAHIPDTNTYCLDLGVSDADFGFGTGDFTIEFQLYPTNTNPRNLVFMYDPGGGTNQPLVWLYYNAGSIRAFINNADRVASGNVMTFNSWQHVALTREGDVFRIFVEGVKYDEQTYVVDLQSAGWCRIGNRSDISTNGLDGYMDEFRITKGVARYTADFSPPPRQFPNQ